MAGEIDEHSSADSLSDWDRTIIMFFTVLLIGISIYYWFFWSDFWVPLLSIMVVAGLYYSIRNDAESMYKPIAKSRDSLIEVTIVLLLLLIWIFVISPLLFDFGYSVLGSLIFEFLLPYLMIVTYFGYTRRSVGLELRRSKTDGFVLVFCGLLIGSRLIILLLSPDGLLILFENSEYLFTGILYLGLVVGFVEEFTFRGIIQNRIALHFRSRMLGIILTSSIFAVMHVMTVLAGLNVTPINVGSSLIYAFMTRLPLGMIMGLVWNDSENLIGVTLIHASNNIAFLLQSLTGL